MALTLITILFVSFLGLMTIPIWITWRGGEDVVLKEVRYGEEDAS